MRFVASCTDTGRNCPLVDADGNIDGRACADCAYLNGCINEALRLNPPVPSMVQRLTRQKESRSATHIFREVCTSSHPSTPPDTVSQRTWFLQVEKAHPITDENIYPHSESFIPERWSTSPELVKSRTAFAPFNAGVYGCIGKPLALLELRCVTAKLLHAFDVQLAPHEDGRRLLSETRDHFTLGLGALDLGFTPRRSQTGKQSCGL